MVGRAVLLLYVGAACGASTRVDRARPTLADAAPFRLADTDEASTPLVEQAVAAARRGAAETFVFDVRTAVGFGCKCPPFHIGTGIFVMPRFAPGVPDAEDAYYSNVSYRFLGRFDGRTISAVQWRREAGQTHTPGEMDTGWDQPAPALVVDDWCLVPHKPFFRNEITEEELAGLKKDGRLCAGAVGELEEVAR